MRLSAIHFEDSFIRHARYPHCVTTIHLFLTHRATENETDIFSVLQILGRNFKSSKNSFALSFYKLYILLPLDRQTDHSKPRQFSGDSLLLN
jgi:hypothetical protein